MGINYLFSRIDRNKGFNDNVIKYIKEDINNNMNITFIASLFNEYEKNDNQVKEIIKIFNDIDIDFNKIYLIDNRISKESAYEYVEKSNIIYLLGGSPYDQMEKIKEYNLFSLLKNREGITIGTSAGAMNQARRIIYKDDFDNYELKDYDGLGFIDLNIYPHYDINNRDYLDEVKEVSNYINIIGLPNNSFIRIKNNNIEVVGEYYLINEEKIMKKIFYNEDNLEEKDINNSVKRARMLIINSNKEVLLGYEHNTYQIIGGHLEGNETYDECVVREVLEETGIVLPEEKRDPFLQIVYYCKDYPKEKLNSEYIINYYSIHTDLKPNMDKVNLTENEKEGLFEFRYISLDSVLDELNNNLKICKNENAVKDTILAVSSYLEENDE